jgi:soluble lytic murein transglycosylase
MAALAVVWPAASVVRIEAAPPPLQASALWLAPSVSVKSLVATAVDDLTDGKPTRALPVLERAARNHELDGYAQFYLGRAELALGRISEARATAAQLLSTPPSGYLGEASLWLSADVEETAGEWSAAVEPLRTLVGLQPLEPERANLRLGRAALKAGDTTLATAAFTKVVSDFGLSPEADEAAGELAKLTPTTIPSHDDFVRLLARAQTLYGAKRYTDARAAFMNLRGWATGEDLALVELRVGECDYFLKHYTATRERLLPLTAQASPKQIEAEFYYFSALRELGQHDVYVARARAFIDAHPSHALAEEALNNLATHYVLLNEDEKAAAVFEELYTRFPIGLHANRAAWRAGWADYKAARYMDAVRIFESAVDGLPHDDYRPSWLYWAARAHQRLGERDAAIAGFRRVVSDYRNSYYGRQATHALSALFPGGAQVETVSRVVPLVTPGEIPGNARVIQDLLASGLYDTAMLEIKKAEREGGASPLLEATAAYALNKKGDLRAAITKMRRAYPQFMAEGGETLPLEIRRVIFPIGYWTLIARSAADQNLDPYLMAALVAQESTFQPDVKSVAGAWGLMQIEPGTGRMYATRLKIKPYTVARLKQPDVNVRIGMASFSDLMKKFNNTAAALAAYNAGDSRAARWLAERRQLDQDEFIDDIPFPETQNYVKRILGTAEDYRALYPDPAPAAPAARKPGAPAGSPNR